MTESRVILCGDDIDDFFVQQVEKEKESMRSPKKKERDAAGLLLLAWIVLVIFLIALGFLNYGK